MKKETFDYLLKYASKHKPTRDEIADEFERKLKKYAQDVKVSQLGTTELFFDSPEKQKLFNEVIQSQGSTLYKILLNYFNKKQVSCGFKMEVSAEPGVGASLNLTVYPPELKGSIKASLNSEFQKIFKESFDARFTKADKQAKSNGGSGTIMVGELALDA